MSSILIKNIKDNEVIYGIGNRNIEMLDISASVTFTENDPEGNGGYIFTKNILTDICPEPDKLDVFRVFDVSDRCQFGQFLYLGNLNFVDNEKEEILKTLMRYEGLIKKVIVFEVKDGEDYDYHVNILVLPKGDHEEFDIVKFHMKAGKYTTSTETILKISETDKQVKYLTSDDREKEVSKSLWADKFMSADNLSPKILIKRDENYGRELSEFIRHNVNKTICNEIYKLSNQFRSFYTSDEINDMITKVLLKDTDEESIYSIYRMDKIAKKNYVGIIVAKEEDK